MEAAWFIFVLAVGACVGSFLNVVIYRLPRGESIVFPGSHCPHCGRHIAWFDNVPLVSYLVLRARCRACKAPISPRYILVEATTIVLVGGLYAWYYLLNLRDGAGAFEQSWPMFAAHAALLCSLLVCAIVDAELWIVPLEVCWAVSVMGVISAAAAPHPFMAKVSPAAGAMALAAAAGLILAIVLVRLGLIRRSFLDADEKAATGKNRRCTADPEAEKQSPSKGDANERKITAVAIGREHGVNPRIEVLREVVFLAPAIVLAAGAYLLVTKVAPLASAWSALCDEAAGGRFARHFIAFQAALFGYLIGGLWIWGMRIMGTLGFGKEALGLGDVHILAAAGAVAGWVVPSVAFFVAPFFGLLWALYLWLSRNQRELPYGPWLAAAVVVVLIFFDAIAELLKPYAETVGTLLHG